MPKSHKLSPAGIKPPKSRRLSATDRRIIEAWAVLNTICAAVEHGSFVAHPVYYTPKYSLLKEVRRAHRILDKLVTKMPES